MTPSSCLRHITDRRVEIRQGWEMLFPIVKLSPRQVTIAGTLLGHEPNAVRLRSVTCTDIDESNVKKSSLNYLLLPNYNIINCLTE